MKHEPLELNLQMFAEANNDGAADAGQNGQQDGQAGQTGQEGQTGQGTLMGFDAYLAAGGQAEFDRRVGKAVQTALSKAQSKFTDPRVEQLQRQLDGYIRNEAVMRADVDPRFAKFVSSEVAESMAEGQTFEDALGKYLEQNPHFKRPQGDGGNTQGWSRHMESGGGQGAPDGVEAAFRRLNPNIKFE